MRTSFTVMISGVFVILSVCLIIQCYGGDSFEMIKNKKTQDIITKLSNFTLKEFNNIDPKDREKAFSDFEKKLRIKLGPTKENVIKIIMKGIKLMAPRQNKPSNEVMFRSNMLREEENDHELNKNQIAEDIVKKLYNLSVNEFRDVASEEKEKVLTNFEQKLKNKLGPTKEKYVKIIMKGLKFYAMKNTNAGPSTEPNMLRDGTELNNTKQLIIGEIANKVSSIANQHTSIHETSGHILTKMQGIKKLLDNFIIKKDSDIHNKHKNIKTFKELVDQGVRKAMINILANESRRVEENLNNNGTEIEIMTENYMKTVTPKPFSCEIAIDLTCNQFKYVNKIICPVDRKQVTLDKLCDGFNDCSDGYDERNCLEIGLNKIKDVIELLGDIEASLFKKCTINSFDKTELAKKNGLLHEVLQIEIRIIKDYSDVKDGDKTHIKSILYDVANLVESLALALEASICPQYTNADKIDRYFRRHNDKLILSDRDDLSDNLEHDKIDAKKCVCVDSFCKNADTCPVFCRRICWQKYSLGRWECPPVIGGTSVSFNVICDGKLDCIDETDEQGCTIDSHKKFEANNIYNEIISMLTSKMKLKEYSLVRHSLLNLQNFIKRLQELTTIQEPDATLVKPLRDSCFTLLIEIFDKNLINGDLDHINEVHMFMASINGKLTNALKLSYTGNDKIMSFNGCYCRDGRCALSICTDKCNRACAVEPLLVRYTCKGDDSKRVIIDKVCDGKMDCPIGDDEADCKKELCRKHHLVHLRYDIRNVGDKQKGTALGEVLKSWRTKVSSSLIVAETNERVTNLMVKGVVTDVLNDLVSTYGALTPSGKVGQDPAMEEFTKLSQRVIETIKSCGH